MLHSDSPWGRRHLVLAMCLLAVVIGYTDRVNISVASVVMGEQLGWSQTTKGFVLSSFFIGYILFMVPSGWLAARFGAKRVLAVAVVAWSMCTLLTPLAASISITALIATRIALGIAEAAVFPASFDMLSRWVPAHERTRAIAGLFSGIPLGQVLGFMLTGWIVAAYGWPMAFYSFGAVGFVWVAAWWARVANDPSADPRISSGESRLLRLSAPGSPRLNGAVFSRLLAHGSVWAIVVCNFCSNWSLFFLLAWLPSYFREVHQLNIASVGLFSAAPWVAALITTNVSAAVCDRAIASGFSITRVRKVTLCLGFLLSAVFLILCQSASAPWIAMLLICGATGALGVTWSGFSPNALDIAPSYAPLIVGFSNTMGTIPGIVGVALTGWLVDTTGSYTIAFAVAALISIGGALFYVVFGRSTPIDIQESIMRPAPVPASLR